MPDSFKDPTVNLRQVSPPTEPAGLHTLDQPLTSLRRRHQHRSGRSRFGRRLLVWGGTAAIALVIVGLIAAPLVYRNLRPAYQERVKHYLPFMSVFDPQRAYQADSLPTVAPAEGDGGLSAADLLLTPDVLIPAGAAGDQATGQPTPNADNLIIVTATPNEQSTELPTAQPTTAPAEALTSPTPQEEAAIAAEPTATWTPLVTATSQAMSIAMLPSARLYGFDYIAQLWNNCGPATLTMGLSYFGWQNDQTAAASYLKPDSEDKNVSPWQMVSYVNENTGVRALYRYAGDMDMIRRLVLEGFPVIVETGFMPEGYDWMGHYRLVVAYDDQLDQLYVYDSYLGHGNMQGLTVSYEQFDREWQHFNRVYMVIYEQAREGELRQVLGEDADLTQNWENALAVARSEATADPENPYAWFNMGTSYLGLGQYDEAARAYDQARNAGSGLPWRMLWYQFGPFRAYYEVGRYDDVLALVQANLGTTPYVEETYYWTGMVYMAREQYGPARSQFNLTLQHNSNYGPAREALAELDQLEAAAAAS